MPEVVKVDCPAPHVHRLLINRAEKRNAVDRATREGLIEAISRVQGDADCRAIVLGGVNGVFSAGGDLPSMVGMSYLEARERMAHGHRLCKLVMNSRVPVISAAEGFCAGAAVGLAMLGDYIVVGQKSRFLFPFLRLGLVPDWGLLRTVPQRVGFAAARKIFMNCQTLTGEEASKIGLADEYVGDGDVMAAAVLRASAMATLSPRAYIRMKKRLLEPSANFTQEFQREEDDQTELLLGPDFREGYAAYAEKREPDFDAPPEKPP
jgi:2-(1,2-epoxy-1,2-dihydrophenyl)acetyl-CoA isomerase